MSSSLKGLLQEIYLEEQIASNSASQDSVVEAINDKLNVIIYYEGDEKILPGYRIIQPFVYGIGYKRNDKVLNNDKPYLRSYVIMDATSLDAIKSIIKNKLLNKDKGAASKGSLPSRSVSLTQHQPSWRLFRADKITYWYPLFGAPSFKNKPLYNPADKNLVKIIAAARF
jgi:hypothetical protein